MDNELYQDKISQGITLMTEEKYEAAKEYFEKAIAESPRAAEGYIHLGNAYVNLEKYDDALEALKKVLLISPENGQAYYSMGSVYVLKGNKLKAIECYNKAEEHGFQSSDMYQIMASIFFETDDIPQALRNISRAINISPLDGKLRLFKAEIYLAHNEYDLALDTLDEMEKILPDAFEAYDVRTQIYSGQKKYKEALKIAERGCKRFPQDVNLALTKLKVYTAAGRKEEGYLWLEEMKRNGLYEKGGKEAALQEITLFLLDNKVEEALEALENTNKKLGGDADLLYLSMDLCGKTGRNEALLSYSEKLIGTECNDFYKATALFYHATALERCERDEEAQKEYRKLTSVMRRYTINDPSFYEGYLYRLLSHEKLKEYDKALELADYISNLYPDKADSHVFRYFIYKGMGDMTAAEEEKRKAKQMNPNLDIQ